MITDLKAFCELFYASTSIPIGYYHASPDNDCSFPSILEDPSVFKGILSGFRHFTKNPDYFISQSFGYYGYIKPEHADCVIIIGPVFSTPISDLTLRTFMQEWAINTNRIYSNFWSIFLRFPLTSFSRHLPGFTCVSTMNIFLLDSILIWKTQAASASFPMYIPIR